MKLNVVFFAVLVASTYANEDKGHAEFMQAMQQKCLKEAGMKMSELESCHKEIKKCPRMKCLIACSMRELGYIIQDGTINHTAVDYLISTVKKDHPKLSASMKKCFKNPPQKTSFCDAGYIINSCMEKEPYD